MTNEPTYVIDGKLDPVFKEKWLAALRSGKYRKGAHALRAEYEDDDGPSFCCLGVACDLIDPDAWNDFEYGKIGWGDESALSTELPFTYGLPLVLTSDIDGKSDYGDVEIKTGEAIARINDNSNTFEDVIRFIEKNL